MWDEFYKQLNTGKVEIPKYKRRQKGGGIGGMYRRRRYKIPVNVQNEDIGKHVTPVAAALERAKSEFKTAVENNTPHVAVEKYIKEKKKTKPFSCVTDSKTTGPLRKRGNPAVRELYTAKPPSKNTSVTKRKRELKDPEPNIFNKKQKQWPI